MKNSKKTISMFVLSAAFMMAACSEKPAQTEVNVEQATPTIIEKTETVVIKEEATETPNKVVLDKNGVKVVTEKIV